MGYTLLIADDEPLERDALQSVASKAVSKDATILVAASGTEAVRLAQNNRIDAALLDIKMPGINGLDAAAEIRAIHPAVRIVFLSAFDYFEYAQRAIRLEAFDYLVKPVEDEAVERVIRRVIETINHTDDAIERLAEVRHFLESEVFDDIIAGDADQEIIRTAFRILEIEERPGYVLVYRALLDRYAFALETAAQRRSVVLRFLRVLKNELEGTFRDILIRAHPGEGYALVLGDAPDAPATLRSAIEVAIARAACPGIVGIRIMDGSAADIPRHVAVMRTCIGRITPAPDAQVVIVDRCEDGPSMSGTNLRTEAVRKEQLLLTCVLSRDVERTRLAADDLWRLLVVDNDEEEVRKRITSIVNYLVHSIRLRDRDLSSWKNVYISDMYTSIHAVKRAFFDAVRALSSRPDYALGDPLARRMHSFLVENYRFPVGLTDLADHCGLSESHCSRSFNRLFGESFTTYLNRIRIDHAKFLLTRTDRTIGEIGEEVGYRDPAYFSRVFRRTEGIRPIEYRDNFAV